MVCRKAKSDGKEDGGRGCFAKKERDEGECKSDKEVVDDDTKEHEVAFREEKNTKADGNDGKDVECIEGVFVFHDR